MESIKYKEITKRMIVGVSVAMIITLVSSLILTSLYNGENISMGNMKWISMITHSMSLFVGTMFSKRGAQIPGIIIGAANIVVYILVIIMMNVTIFDGVSGDMLWFILAVIAGALTSMAVVVPKAKYRHR